jgi:hypothetical protein
MDNKLMGKFSWGSISRGNLSNKAHSTLFSNILVNNSNQYS